MICFLQEEVIMVDDDENKTKEHGITEVII